MGSVALFLPFQRSLALRFFFFFFTMSLTVTRFIYHPLNPPQLYCALDFSSISSIALWCQDPLSVSILSGWDIEKEPRVVQTGGAEPQVTDGTSLLLKNQLGTC